MLCGASHYLTLVSFLRTIFQEDALVPIRRTEDAKPYLVSRIGDNTLKGGEHRHICAAHVAGDRGWERGLSTFCSLLLVKLYSQPSMWFCPAPLWGYLALLESYSRNWFRIEAGILGGFCLATKKRLNVILGVFDHGRQRYLIHHLTATSPLLHLRKGQIFFCPSTIRHAEGFRLILICIV